MERCARRSRRGGSGARRGGVELAGGREGRGVMSPAQSRRTIWPCISSRATESRASSRASSRQGGHWQASQRRCRVSDADAVADAELPLLPLGGRAIIIVGGCASRSSLALLRKHGKQRHARRAAVEEQYACRPTRLAGSADVQMHRHASQSSQVPSVASRDPSRANSPNSALLPSHHHWPNCPPQSVRAHPTCSSNALISRPAPACIRDRSSS